MKLPTMSRVDAIAFVLRNLITEREVDTLLEQSCTIGAPWSTRPIALRVSLDGRTSFQVGSPNYPALESRPGITVPHTLSRAVLRGDPSGLSDLAIDLVDRAAVFA